MNIESLIKEQFSSFAFTSIDLCSEGADHFCYEVDGEWIFRFPKDEKAALYDKKELQLLPLLSPLLPVPIPEPKWVGKPSLQFPYSFIGYRKLKGEPLSCFMEKESYVAPLAHFLKRLHGLQRPYFLPSLKERDLISSIKKGIQLLQNYGFSEKVLQQIKHPKGREAISQCFVHGDLYARHILGDKGTICGVIDWGGAGWGDPAMDLSLLYSSFTSREREEFFAIYGPISQGLEERCRLYALFFSIKQALKGHLYHQPLLLKEGLEGIKNTL